MHSAFGLVAGEIYQLDFPVADVVLQQYQKILVAGHGAHIYCLDEATSTIRRRPGGLFRLDSDGSIDQSFNNRMSAIDYLKLSPDGRLLVQGAFNDPKRLSPVNCLLVVLPTFPSQSVAGEVKFGP